MNKNTDTIENSIKGTMHLIPKNWDKFQQYKDRKPTWIKFHRDLLNDFSYSSVQIGTKATLPLLWLLACEYENGTIKATAEEISFRIHIDLDTINTALIELIERGFFSLVPNCTEEYKILPREEREREEEKEIKTEKKTEKKSNALNVQNIYDELNVKFSNDVKEMKYHLNTEAYEEWIIFKQEIKNKVTPTSAKQQIKLLCRYTEDVQRLMIEKSIGSGYKGLFEISGNRAMGNTNNSSQSKDLSEFGFNTNGGGNDGIVLNAESVENI